MICWPFLSLLHPSRRLSKKKPEPKFSVSWIKKEGFILMNYLAGWKTESIQTVNVVMWNKTVFRANDSDVCVCAQRHQKKRVKSYTKDIYAKKRDGWKKDAGNKNVFKSGI